MIGAKFPAIDHNSYLFSEPKIINLFTHQKKIMSNILSYFRIAINLFKTLRISQKFRH